MHNSIEEIGDKQGKFFSKILSRFENLCAKLILLCAILGWLAQLVERLPYKQDVTGSSPVLPILYFK